MPVPVSKEKKLVSSQINDLVRAYSAADIKNLLMLHSELKSF
jgi:hypothetical protein